MGEGAQMIAAIGGLVMGGGLVGMCRARDEFETLTSAALLVLGFTLALAGTFL